MRIESAGYNLPGHSWLRGNLHAHTTISDGKLDPQAVLNAYAKLGHDFLMISDHDVYTSPADYAKWDARGLVLIPGNEVTSQGEHLLHVNANCRVEPQSDRQPVLDEIARQRGFAVVNHPNWSCNDPNFEWAHVGQQKLNTWRGYIGIEIYNGTIGRLHGSQYALDRWDRLLSTGRRAWGFANDDSHSGDEIGMGWNVVYSSNRSVEAIVEALTAGRFYASTGVVISKIEVDGERIRIATENADRIVATTTGQRRFAIADSGQIEVTVPPNEKYVRFECYGRGEQFAWTQPFYLNP